ncbi:response regulator transcription factor [Streptomyces sp. NPDC059917]|uniref:helix-turn-helix transcriptional regulator n=1 Tax=Streptomyces sp. NPDC059917 TaxID=3347002 RepID=UPI00365C5BA2
MQPVHQKRLGGTCHRARSAKGNRGGPQRPSPPSQHGRGGAAPLPFGQAVDALAALALPHRAGRADWADADGSDGAHAPSAGRSAEAAAILAMSWCRLAREAIDRGQYLRAVELLGRARRLAGISWPRVSAEFTVTKMALDWHTGQWAALDAEIGRTGAGGGAGAAAPSARSVSGTALAVLSGRLALAHGDLVAAESSLRKALRAEAMDAAAGFRPQAAAALARLLISRGEEAEALAVVHRELTGVRCRGMWWGGVELAPVITEILGRHDPVRAAAFIEELASGTVHRTMPLSAAVVADCRGRLAEAMGDGAGAAEHYRVAADRYTALPRPYDAALALEGVGRCRFATGRSGASEIKSAMVTFDAVGARWDSSRCRALLRGQGLSPASARGHRHCGCDLSLRVGDVAQLAALGRTNREIAEALHLSRRTVEEYVSTALRKFGVTSRRDFPAAHGPTDAAVAPGGARPGEAP